MPQYGMDNRKKLVTFLRLWMEVMTIPMTTLCALLQRVQRSNLVSKIHLVIMAPNLITRFRHQKTSNNGGLLQSMLFSSPIHSSKRKLEGISIFFSAMHYIAKGKLAQFNGILVRRMQSPPATSEHTQKSVGVKRLSIVPRRRVLRQLLVLYLGKRI